MLTIREPIKLKCGRPMHVMHQDMGERMQANYGLMNLSIRKEELLHLTSQPAEIYFADSENFQILNNINNQNQQQVRLEVINNLMNRIMVAQTENFTYQDTVYISNVLRKLGIRDEKTFMKQVFELQNEHKETRHLLQKYEKNQELLQLLLKSEETPEANQVVQQQIWNEQNVRYYIHDEIYRRLNTNKIYQDIRQFSKTYIHESHQIHPKEMQVAEQTKVAQTLMLQNIKNEVMGKVSPLYYLQNNRYEYLQDFTEAMTQNLEEQITAAILLNLTEQSYVLRQKQIEENSHYWYSVANSLFQTSENTWKRYELNLTERRTYSSLMSQMLEEVNEVKHLEGDIISNIAEEYYNHLQQWKEVDEVKQNILMQKNIQEVKQQEVHFSGGSYHMTEEEFQLNFLTEEDEEGREAETLLTTEQLQKQLEIYNQKNYENYQKITELQKQQINIKDRKVNRRKAQMDALRALENPEQVLMEYMTVEHKDPVEEAREKAGAQIYELFSEETKEIYRQFLTQHTSENTTFLEHVMNQPQESETRQEVIQVLEQVERQGEVVRTRLEETETVDRKRLFIDRELQEKITKQLTLWKEIQKYPVLDMEAAVYLQSNAGEIVHTQDTQVKHLLEELQSEKHLETAIIHKVNETAETELTLLNEITEGTVTEVPEVVYLQDRLEKIFRTQEVRFQNIKDEIKNTEYVESVITQRVREDVETQLILFKDVPEEMMEESSQVQSIQEKTEETFQTQEIQYTQLKENVEKQIKRQKEEMAVINASTQKEVRRQQIEFVHKKEEQLVNEELLEEIREHSQKTVKTEEKEETTVQNNKMTHQVVQDSINRIQTTRTEDIEELIQQSVRRQLNHLSEQVYGKLEKKLETERKRRGYF